MSRTTFFGDVSRALKIALYCESTTKPTSKVLGQIGTSQPTRRQFLGAAAALGTAALPGFTRASGVSGQPRIAIIGGGLAGLACADRLEKKGYRATIYEAASRYGGRCFSNRTLVPGMACENGGELIDTAHKTMLGYANEFNLARENIKKKAGEESYFFFGQRWDETEVIDQFRAVVSRMQPDLHSMSGSASFYSHNQADIDLDNTDLASYLASRCVGFPLIEAVLNEAYLAEYGLETSEQSTLNFLGFMRLNKQSKFEPFGVSDEKFHLAQGNDGIVSGLVNKLQSTKLTGSRLTRIAKDGFGKFQLFFNGSSVPELADSVVITVPFSVLRNIDLDSSLGLSAEKMLAIQSLGYGNNAKTMIAFDGRPWTVHDSNGGAYSDLNDVQTAWESNRVNAGSRGIITDYSSGIRGASLSVAQLQSQVDDFLTGYDQILPGSKAAASRDGSQYVAHLEHWPSNPLSLGSYTCYTVGQFTTIEGLAGEPSGLLKFAGEHADSFYSWQGFMEGACLSGIRAANEVLADIRAGRV